MQCSDGLAQCHAIRHASTLSCNAISSLFVISGSSETVAELIQAGADVNAKAAGGVTALHTAAECGSIETVKALLQVLNMYSNTFCLGAVFCFCQLKSTCGHESTAFPGAITLLM